jgi:Kdo2-lipid IVA lauroyltransferase/acyltransferase
MDSDKISLTDKAVCAAAKIFFRFISILPRFIAYAMCESLALLFCLIDRKHRRIGMVNLGIAFPDKSLKWRKKTLYKSFRQLGIHAVELSHLHHISPLELKSRVRYNSSYKYYSRAREEKRGLVFLTAHLGCWELISTAHGAHGHQLNILVRPLDNPCLDDWLSAGRSKFGTGIINKRNALRQMLSLLRNDREVGILPDQNVQEKDGVYVPLFGKPASTSGGPAAIVMKTRCPVIAAFILPDRKKGHYVIEMSPPIEFVDSGNREQDLITNTAIYNKHLEEGIKKFPAGWLWGHRRFKTQADGSNPYEAESAG